MRFISHDDGVAKNVATKLLNFTLWPLNDVLKCDQNKRKIYSTFFFIMKRTLTRYKCTRLIYMTPIGSTMNAAKLNI